MNRASRARAAHLQLQQRESFVSDRLEQLHAWLGDLLGQADYRLVPASADASARRYWRLYLGADSRIVMDAPPPEDCTRFVVLARRLRASGLRTPAIHAASLEQGFLLLDDLGDRTYLDALEPATADELYQDAIEALLRWQSRDAGADLPPYDAALLARELAIFRDWFLKGLLGLELSAPEQALLQAAERRLIASALEQPQVCVHRDYHSRNLMRLDAENPGILDFQDAVCGPITYDLVSLLRDCYIAWPPEQVERWALGYLERARALGLIGSGIEAERFLGWFDRMGMQRHLKAIGIFARLKLRDGKDGYLKDIPRTLGYVREAAARDPELADLGGWIDERLSGHPRWGFR